MDRRRAMSHFRAAVVAVLLLVTVTSLRGLDESRAATGRNDKLYFPSGEFLVESSLGFREAMADWLWFRFIQYYGGYKKGENDLRYLDSVIASVNQLDPRFIEAYYLASFIYWSDLGQVEKSYDILRRGILANPDNARLHFQVGFMHYVLDHDYHRAALWFELAGKCPDATEKEQRFAAFARYRAGDDRVSLALWKELLESSVNPDMQELAATMIEKLERKLALRKLYGDTFIGPIPEI
ncbi:MAG: hypothetical protein GY838_12380 [bacterium]|nr:hypothetical protein [bacterium]